MFLKAVLSKKNLWTQADYIDCVHDLLEDKNILRLRDFGHHSGTTRFQHSLNVSYYNFLLCRFFRLDARAGARAGLMHDLFFYDRIGHEPIDGRGWHCTEHPKVAFFNASELFPINQVEGDMIASHMWPLAPHMPRYRETYVITLVDKFCAVAEVLSHTFSLGFRKLRLAEAFALVVMLKITLH